MKVSDRKPCNHKDHHGNCLICERYKSDPRYRELWGGDPRDIKTEDVTQIVTQGSKTRTPHPSSVQAAAGCVNLGNDTGQTVECPSCRGTIRLKLFECRVFGQCTIAKKVNGVACCRPVEKCLGYSTSISEKPNLDALTPKRSKPDDSVREKQEIKKGKQNLTWSYGVTTVVTRISTPLLSDTLQSLKETGFDEPRIFIDGVNDVRRFIDLYGTESITARYPRVGAFGNWILALWELYLRDPFADRYALFQDDIKCCKGLKMYLSLSPFPERGYLNLYTFPFRDPNKGKKDRNVSQRIPPRAEREERSDEKGYKLGFYESNQLGKGALALVFTRDGVLEILRGYDHIITRPFTSNVKKRTSAIDGGVVDTMRKAGFKEYVHNPSLVQHAGIDSTMGNAKHPQAPTFPGEGFDSLSLLQSGE